MDCKEIVFTRHAIQRMFERRIGRDEVRRAIANGEIIEEHPEDLPFPSYLLLSTSGSRHLHVVVAPDPTGSACYLVTVYFPDPDLWDAGFKTRKTP